MPNCNSNNNKIINKLKNSKIQYSTGVTIIKIDSFATIPFNIVVVHSCRIKEGMDSIFTETVPPCPLKKASFTWFK